MIAAESGLPEVSLSFGGRIPCGWRAVEADADGLAAFASPRIPPLGIAGISIDIDCNRVLAALPVGRLRVRELGLPQVAALRLFAGITTQLVRNVLQPPTGGLVQEAYGVGNAPDRDQDLLDTL